MNDFSNVKNMNRFNQRFDSSTLPCGSSDLDIYIHHWGKLLIYCEYKTEGTAENISQRRHGEITVKQQGLHQPTFYLFCHHDTKPDEAVTALNTKISKVYYSSPLFDGKVHVYKFPVDQRPSLNSFVAQACARNGVDILSLLEKWDPNSEPIEYFHDPRFVFDPKVAAAFKNSAVMGEISRAEYFDWDAFSNGAQELMSDLGYEGDDRTLDFHDQVFVPWTDLEASVKGDPKLTKIVPSVDWTILQQEQKSG